MRCRKVRSYLSAYCSGELSSRLKPTISEHLSVCSTCRQEEALYRSMTAAATELPALKVSSEFNGKLLNRIAQQRFAETRTKAFLPRRAPALRWGQVIPAFVTTALVIVLAIVALSPDGILNQDTGVIARQQLDDSYLTVQPADQAQKVASLDRHWSLGDQLARAEKMERLSSSIRQQATWSGIQRSSGLMMASSHERMPVPYMPGQFRMRPVVKVYVWPQPPTAREGRRAY